MACLAVCASQSTVNTEGCWLHATPVERSNCQYGVWAHKSIFFCANAPFGAVYTALRPALRQVQQVGCLLELLLELRAVPVGFYIVRRASSRMRLVWNVPVVPVMEYDAFLQVCIVFYDGVWLI